MSITRLSYDLCNETGPGLAMGMYCNQSGHVKALRKAVAIGCALSTQLVVSACASDQVSHEPFTVSSNSGNTLMAVPLATFNQPWAMTFLPDGALLVTEKPGNLWLLRFSDSDELALDNGQGAPTTDDTSPLSVTSRIPVQGLPAVTAAGQGGLGDVVLHPDFSNNALVYLSYVERDGNLSGAVVARARLEQKENSSARLTEFTVIWKQSPKVTGQGHYGHRLAFSSENFLYITSGERQKFDPAQDMETNLGKVIRLHDDGRVPVDNPFTAHGTVASQVWSLGHRNPLGIAFDQFNQLWVHEMGPRGGDELNLIERGANYGYPVVSEGKHYNGVPIPDHATHPEFNPPAISWTPVISPAGLVVYSGSLYEGWEGTGLMGGLSSQSLVRVQLDNPAVEQERYNMKRRIRELEQGPEGYVYALEDKSGGRLIRLMP